MRTEDEIREKLESWKQVRDTTKDEKEAILVQGYYEAFRWVLGYNDIYFGYPPNVKSEEEKK